MERKLSWLMVIVGAVLLDVLLVLVGFGVLDPRILVAACGALLRVGPMVPAGML